MGRVGKSQAYNFICLECRVSAYNFHLSFLGLSSSWPVPQGPGGGHSGHHVLSAHSTLRGQRGKQTWKLTCEVLPAIRCYGRSRGERWGSVSGRWTGSDGGTELLGRSQPCDIRRKGVSGWGKSRGKGPKVGMGWCVGGKETRLGYKRLGLRS